MFDKIIKFLTGILIVLGQIALAIILTSGSLALSAWFLRTIS
jgi:hypothetical protein